jgi:biotin carboxyl carrier protein
MAELTATSRKTDSGDGHGDLARELEAAAAPVAVDPRAVRVRLGPTSRLGDEPIMRVAPPSEPLRMTNPTVGRGPLGGTTLAEPPGRAPDPDAAVLAQRQPVVDGEPRDAAIRPAGRGRWVIDDAGDRTRVVLEPLLPGDGGARHREVIVDGFRFDVEVESERIAALRERATKGRASSAHGGPLEVKAIIPGKVVAVSIGPGDEVTAGQQLLVVEAMKMQNELRSPRDGTIERVGVAPGVNIEVGDLLVVIS